MQEDTTSSKSIMVHGHDALRISGLRKYSLAATVAAKTTRMALFNRPAGICTVGYNQYSPPTPHARNILESPYI